MRGFGLVGRGCLSGHPQAERLITGACLLEALFFFAQSPGLRKCHYFFGRVSWKPSFSLPQSPGRNFAIP